MCAWRLSCLVCRHIPTQSLESALSKPGGSSLALGLRPSTLLKSSFQPVLLLAMLLVLLLANGKAAHKRERERGAEDDLVLCCSDQRAVGWRRGHQELMDICSIILSACAHFVVPCSIHDG